MKRFMVRSAVGETGLWALDLVVLKATSFLGRKSLGRKGPGGGRTVSRKVRAVSMEGS